MKTCYVFIVLSIALLNAGTVVAQCSGGSSFATIAAPTTTATTTISSCNFAGDYNTITGITAGNSYTFTAVQDNGTDRCITIHTGSSSGPVVAYGLGTVTFTAATSGTYYMTVTKNCVGCGSATACITTTVACNSCATGPCADALNIGGCGQVYTTSTTGSSSYVSSLCATATPGLESVFTYTATSTGDYSFDISSVTGGGYAIGYGTVASGCGSTGWTCVGAYATPGATGTLTLASGTTYYFLFDATSSGASSITFTLTCPTGGPTVAGDCGIAANVCSDAAFSIDPNGYGTNEEICYPAGTCAANPDLNPASFNSGCLLSGELNSTWMVVNVLTGGSLTFSMGTPNSGTFNCLDWSMWPYSPTACSSISAGTLAPVRCNYNGDCEEFTGLASSLPTGASSMSNWESPVTAASGSQYVICLSNYSSAITTVPLSFGGTAVVSCTPLGNEMIELAGTAETGYNSLSWTSSLELNADKYIVERSTDGEHYSAVGSLDAEGFTMESKNYFYNDVTPERGVNYYRIALVHNNGSKLYSNLLSVNQSFAHMTDVIRAYPNPVSDKLNVLLNADDAAPYELSLSALNGNEVFHTTMDAKKGVNQVVIGTDGYANGFYLLRVILEGKTIATQKIIVQ